MKKDNQKFTNIITTTALSLLCIGILGGAFLLNQKQQKDFLPEPPAPAAENVTWSEAETKPAEASIQKEPESQEAPFQTGSPEDEIYQIVESEGDEVVVNLTPPVTKPAVAEVTPESKAVKSCPDKAVAVEPEVTPETSPTPEPAQSGTPAPDTTPPADDHAGQVYDPVFGWMEPGTPQADVLDNDGDVNKQIGYIE